VIKFNVSYQSGLESEYVAKAIQSGVLAGDNRFGRKAESILERLTGSKKVLLTPSCTAALEMCAIGLGIEPGDEIIMPSNTFVSTATAFVMQGAVPVFIDIRNDTLNIDEERIEAAITERTRCIVAVHYAGVSCEMDRILDIARRYNLTVVEDAAQSLMSTYNGKALGTLGDLGTISFHETKNISCGEGGAIYINNDALGNTMEVVREKGTDRSMFFRGEIDKYTWRSKGSSYLLGELSAAYLCGQLHNAELITNKRLDIWNAYHERLKVLERAGLITTPVVPDGCIHNGHLYYIVLRSDFSRERVLKGLLERGVMAVSHYVPLHTSPGGRKYGRYNENLLNTDKILPQLVRLPLYAGLTQESQDIVISSLEDLLTGRQ